MNKWQMSIINEIIGCTRQQYAQYTVQPPAVLSWPLVCKIYSADTRLLLLSVKKKHLNANLGIGDLNVNIWAGAGRGGGGSQSCQRTFTKFHSTRAVSL